MPKHRLQYEILVGQRCVASMDFHVKSLTFAEALSKEYADSHRLAGQHLADKFPVVYVYDGQAKRNIAAYRDGKPTGQAHAQEQ